MLENYDINTKTLKKNAFRVTKRRYKTAIRIRVPGGHLDVKHFDLIKEIAEKYGNGTVHLTTRQGFEIPEIDMKFMPEVNEMVVLPVSCAGINDVFTAGDVKTYPRIFGVNSLDLFEFLQGFRVILI